MSESDRTYRIEIAEDSTQRLDIYLSEHDELDLSRSKIQKLLSENNILVNDQPADKKQKVSKGDIVSITLPEPEPTHLIAEEIPLEIVYDDQYLAVVNKPAGLVTHPGAGNRQGTLVNALLYHFKNLAEGSQLDRPGIVHRLDKETSGLLVIAKDDKVYRLLQEGIQSREIKRSYLALVCGHLQEDSGRIEFPIGRSNRDRKKMMVADDGRDAVTDYQLLKRYRTYDLLDISLQTGRTHQIRVHFAHLGHPVFGDPDYGGREKWHRGIFGPERPLAKKILSLIKRQALHAYKLEFAHPINGEAIKCEINPPSDMTKLLNVLDNEGA